MKNKICALSLVLALLLSICLPGSFAFAAAQSASAQFSGNTAVAQNMSVSMANSKVNVTDKDGKSGWLLDCLDKRSYIMCNIDDSVMKNLPSTAKVLLTVTYYDDSYGGFAVLYDALGDTASTNSVYCQLNKTGSWQTASFYITDALFGNGIANSDFVIMANDSYFRTDAKQIMGVSSNDILISSVSVEVCTELAPFNITVGTDRPGNIFFEGDSLDFGIKFADATGAYKTGTASYTVKDINGKTVQTKTAPFSNNFYTLTLDKLPFGVYTLEIVATGSNIRQKKIADFSYSKKAKNVNPNFGTNIHFDWNVYGRSEIKALADLAKNAGYSIIRSSIRWNQIERKQGVYALTDNLEYSCKYVDQLGMETLGILTGDCAYEIDGQILGRGGPNKPTTENQVKAYADYCNWTVNALKDYTDYWSYINEYNLVPGGRHEDESKVSYVNLVKNTYKSIKSANPHAVVVAGEVGGYWTAQRSWIDYSLDNDVLSCSDVYTLHTYDQVGGPETWHIYGSIPDFNKRIKSRNGAKRAWITENGWPAKEINGLGSMHSMVPYEKQGAYYARSMGLNIDPERIDKMIYYAFADNNTGYFDIEDNYGILKAHDYRTPFAAKPAYLTVAAYNAILDGYTYDGDYNGDHSSLMNNGWDVDDHSVSCDYSDAKFMRSFKNSDGDEIVMAWKSEYIKNDETYTYSSDKPYFEIYDMYGNKTVVENTNGGYTASYSNKPIYIHATDSVENTGITAENADTAWRIGSIGKVNVKVNLPESVKSGTSIKIIAAAYGKDNTLLGTQIKEGTYGGEEITVSFAGAKMKGCRSVKIFAIDDMERLTPLVENGVIPEFGDDSSVKVDKSGKTVMLSGKLPTGKAYTNVLITAFDGSTHRADLNVSGGFANSVIYQDMVRTNLDGAYTLRFKIPDDYAGDKIKVHISAQNTVLQKIIYLN